MRQVKKTLNVHSKAFSKNLILKFCVINGSVGDKSIQEMNKNARIPGQSPERSNCPLIHIEWFLGKNFVNL